jgi:hypothetical protein
MSYMLYTRGIDGEVRAKISRFRFRLLVSMTTSFFVVPKLAADPQRRKKSHVRSLLAHG